MDMEARSYSPDQARQLLQKVKEYKADLTALKEKARRGAAGAGGGPDARAELGLAGDYYQTSAGQRDRLLTATDRLNKTSDRIQQGRQQLHETEVRRPQAVGLRVGSCRHGLVCGHRPCLYSVLSRLGQPTAPAPASPALQRQGRLLQRKLAGQCVMRPPPATTAGQAIGANILADLQRQRQQIEHTRQQAQQTDANVATADSTLTRMSQWWRLW